MYFLQFFYFLGAYLTSSNVYLLFYFGAFFRLPFPIFFVIASEAKRSVEYLFHRNNKKGFPLKSGRRLILNDISFF